MKKLLGSFAVAALASLTLSGCGSVNSMLNERTETHEFLRIFDIKTTAPEEQVGEALEKGMSYNLNHPQIDKPLVMTPVPETPGRFTTDDALTNTNLSRLMQLNGGSAAQMRIMVCKDSPWKGVGVRTSSTADWDGRVSVCLFPYKGGYHVDMYGYLSVKKGGLNEIVRSGVYSVVGDPVQWIEKSMLDVVREVRSSLNAEVTLVEARPALKGIPWLLDPGVDVQTTEKAK